MGTRSFSDAELLELHKQGLRPADIARRLNVGRAAVSKRLKKLREQVVPEVVKEFGLEGNSGIEVINRGLNAMDQLLKINGIVNRELDFLQESIAKCDPLQRPALQKQQLQHIAEVRAQISLMAQIAQTLSHYEEIRNFQETVLHIIGDADEHIRDNILQALSKRAAVTGLVGFSE